jgi:phage shock protein A
MSRAEAMIQEKVKGHEIKAAPAPKPRGQVIDIMAALKQSLAEAEGKQPAASASPHQQNASENPVRSSATCHPTPSFTPEFQTGFPKLSREKLNLLELIREFRIERFKTPG